MLLEPSLLPLYPRLMRYLRVTNSAASRQRPPESDDQMTIALKTLAIETGDFLDQQMATNLRYETS